MSSNKRQVRRKKKNLHHLEPLFQGVREALVHDLADADMQRLYGMKERGSEVQPISDGAPPYVFKKIQQLLNFGKRIIWSTDKSFDVLSAESFKVFVDSQQGFQCPEPMSRRVSLVIHEAQRICHEILGEFDVDEWLDSCSFGKRAAMNLPRTEAYLDTRFTVLQGTQQQVAWFKHAVSRDVHLQRAVRKRCRLLKVIHHIKAVAVPKSWKTARIMAPDTIIGGFLSRGLGVVMRRKLEKNTHIDLAIQQDLHKKWAREASKNGRSSTIDMSKASDSFVRRHLELLLPDSWLYPLDCVRTPVCDVNGRKILLRSFMLMGSGHTFPLQTILFYCLAKATCNLLNSKGRVSVYGDDIIVPTKCAKPFIVVMSELGFTINSEKSFYDEPDLDRPSHTFFRESCGGDYKGGIDVRPYMPECDLQELQEVPRNIYVAWCHRLINGLLDRWTCDEVPVTLAYLLREINNKNCEICLVPEWEVDHSGVRHELTAKTLFGLDVSTITYHRSMPIYQKLVNHRVKRKRKVDERPYQWYSYWLKRNMRASNVVPFTLDSMLQSERMERIDLLYDTGVALAGEPNRRLEGTYRWKTLDSQRKD
jgi:hypothetical protein